ncbi:MULTISPECIES: hypothetical protein [unclassified Hyphomonas]|uniref:hypothetical protein n=1 Tax=unclassified Hyphomonas TaxID=2630699 RepID=UPI0025C33C61|nr:MULTISPECIES: hypothetical protein [unclassified Hyphomonas]
MKLEFRPKDQSAIQKVINACVNSERVDQIYRRLVGALSLHRSVEEAKSFCSDHLEEVIFVPRGREYDVQFECGVQLSLHRTSRDIFYTKRDGAIVLGTGLRVFLKN